MSENSDTGGSSTMVADADWLAPRRFNPMGGIECRATYGTPERSHGTPSASNPSRKKAPKAPPRVQKAGRLM